MGKNTINVIEENLTNAVFIRRNDEGKLLIIVSSIIKESRII